jgi:hypothetical protein
MGTLSIYHWLMLIAVGVALVVPFWKIFPRAGWPPALALVMAVSPINIVLLWILAFKRWPGDR